MSQQEHIELLKKFEQVQITLDMIVRLLMDLQTERNVLGGWIHGKDVQTITRLSRTQLHKMRKEGRLSDSTLATKSPWYKVSDLIKLLNENEKKR